MTLVSFEWRVVSDGIDRDGPYTVVRETACADGAYIDYRVQRNMTDAFIKARRQYVHEKVYGRGGIRILIN